MYSRAAIWLISFEAWLVLFRVFLLCMHTISPEGCTIVFSFRTAPNV